MGLFPILIVSSSDRLLFQTQINDFRTGEPIGELVVIVNWMLTSKPWRSAFGGYYFLNSHSENMGHVERRTGTTGLSIESIESCYALDSMLQRNPS